MNKEEIKEKIKQIDDIEDFDFWCEIAQAGAIRKEEFYRRASEFITLYLKYATEGFDNQ